jgi:CheY-like chemotaxis protein
MPKQSILVVEDTEEDFILLERAFQRAKLPATLVWAKDGQEAKKVLLDQQRPLPQLILADLRMPRCSGHELLVWIRSQPYLRRIPVVMLSVSQENADIDKSYDLGVNSYLIKPTGPEDFYRLVDEIRTYWLTLNLNPDIVRPEAGTTR